MSPTDDEVEVALAAVAAEDPEAADAARALLEGLTAGEELDDVLQLDLQDELWFRMPRRWMTGVGEQLTAAAALGDVFERLGMDRYAAICRDPATREIIARWVTDPAAARQQATEALQASGVAPPDVADLAWGEVMGIAEARAVRTVSGGLEDAIADGRITPGTSGWLTAQRKITTATLHVPSPGGETLLEEVRAERLERWFQSGSQPRRRLLSAVRDLISEPPAPPADPAAVVGPVLHLLVEAGDEGIQLTGTHRLRPAFVEAMAERFDWRAPGTRRLEDDVTQVWRTRELAEDLGLLHRRGDRLKATRRGRQLREDPTALWRTAAGHLCVGREIEPAVTRLLLATLLDGAEHDFAPVVAQVREVLTADGWRDREGNQPITTELTRRLLWQRLPLLGALEVVTETRWRGDHSVALTDEGRATARQGLHAAATGPVTELR